MHVHYVLWTIRLGKTCIVISNERNLKFTILFKFFCILTSRSIIYSVHNSHLSAHFSKIHVNDTNFLIFLKYHFNFRVSIVP